MALRVGMIGCGGIARAHYAGWEKLKGKADLVALADVSAANRAWFKERAPDAVEYDDFMAMIDKEKLDAVDICLPHHLHHPCIMKTIERGGHWLCEKPLCMTLDEAADIDRAMQGKKLIGMSAHNQAFFPGVLEAKRLMDLGTLGEIYSVLCEDCFIMGLQPAGSLPGTPGWTAVGPGSWRADLSQMGGGELIDTGYHPTYRLLFFAGGEPTQVAAVTGTYRNKHMKAEDTATVIVKFDNGISGMVRTSWGIEMPRGHYPFHIIGEHGELYGGPSEVFFKPCRFEEPAKISLPEVNSFEAEVVHFIDCIEQSKPPLQSYVDGIRVLKVIRDAYHFVEQGVKSVR